MTRRRSAELRRKARAKAPAQAGGEGEVAGPAGGEGEDAGDGTPPKISLLRDLGYMTGHMRAGLALCQAGGLAAARTHMGHPIAEKYDAVAKELDEIGFR